MDVATTPPPQVSASAVQGGSTDGALSSDFETFLQMLTVQMQNQDPLNPLESTDFAVQLATFSGVEQQVRTNDLLSDLASALGGSPVAQYASWIGRDARVAAAADFQGDPVSVELPALSDADGAELLVRNQAGQIVDRRPVSVEGGNVIWDGQSVTGESFLPGLYSFAIEGRKDGEVTKEKLGEIYSQIEEARIAPDGSVELVFTGGATAKPDAVTALRNASL